jgi:hypothetical protein
MPAQNRTLVFTADDLGWDENTNLAIERAHREGVLTAASLMPGQPGTAHALEIIRRNPGLHIGWHFHACDSRPLTCRTWPWRNSAARAGIALAVSPAARRLIREELAEQWNQLTATGVNVHFINGHHHLHIHPFIAREMQRLIAGSFAGWVRGFEARFFGEKPQGSWFYQTLSCWSARWLKPWPASRRTDSLWGLDRTFRMNAQEVAQVLPTLPAGFHEFMFHPRKTGDADETALRELKRFMPLTVAAN